MFWGNEGVPLRYASGRYVQWLAVRSASLTGCLALRATTFQRSRNSVVDCDLLFAKGLGFLEIPLYKLLKKLY